MPSSAQRRSNSWRRWPGGGGGQTAGRKLLAVARREDAHEEPADGAVDRHEEVKPPILISHLRQVFHVDVQVAGVVRLEELVRGLWLLRL